MTKQAQRDAVNRQFYENGWWFTSYEGVVNWVGLAKKERFLTGDLINEPGEVWFEFGQTMEQSLTAIRLDVQCEMASI